MTAHTAQGFKPLCQTCWQAGEPSQHFPESHTYGLCEVCGDAALVVDAHPETVRAAAALAVTPHEHRWWHADGVTRHLVCSLCGQGLHGIETRDYPHEVLLPDGLRPCTLHVWPLSRPCTTAGCALGIGHSGLCYFPERRCTATYSALGLSCDRPAGHPGDHTDRTYDAPSTLAWSPAIADRR